MTIAGWTIPPVPRMRKPARRRNYGLVVWTTEAQTVMWTTQGHFEGTTEAYGSNYLSPTIQTDLDTVTTTDAVLLAEGFSWLQKSPANKPSARYGHAMTYDIYRDKTVLFGGYDSTGRRNDTWNGTALIGFRFMAHLHDCKMVS